VVEAEIRLRFVMHVVIACDLTQDACVHLPIQNRLSVFASQLCVQSVLMNHAQNINVIKSQRLRGIRLVS